MVHNETHIASGSDAAPAVLTRLQHGKLEVRGRLVNASNATLYCTSTWQEQTSVCIYKPRSGERPLWDFPTGTLSQREVAAYWVSQTLGWEIVPPTVWRDGPFGPGMVQQWIDVDESVDLVELIQSDRDDLRQMAVFDVVVNNADRKGGHLLPTAAGHIYGIDHGLCFSDESKVRTLLWQWEGLPIPDHILQDLRRLRGTVSDESGSCALLEHLSELEVAATVDRIDALLASPTHPGPSPDWPALPWPPF